MRSLGVIALLLTIGLMAPVAAHADEFDPVAPIATPAGYTGPPIYGAWAKTGAVTTILVYAPAERRWGVRRVVRQWNAASSVQLVLTPSPCQGCITIRQSNDPADFASYLPLVPAGLTDYRQTNGVMESCDVLMNAAYLKPFFPRGTRNATAHEIGHCLGLGHSTRHRTMMGTQGERDDGPTALDLAWVRQLYGK